MKTFLIVRADDDFALGVEFAVCEEHLRNVEVADDVHNVALGVAAAVLHFDESAKHIVNGSDVVDVVHIYYAEAHLHSVDSVDGWRYRVGIAIAQCIEVSDLLRFHRSGFLSCGGLNCDRHIADVRLPLDWVNKRWVEQHIVAVEVGLCKPGNVRCSMTHRVIPVVERLLNIRRSGGSKQVGDALEYRAKGFGSYRVLGLQTAKLCDYRRQR